MNHPIPVTIVRDNVPIDLTPVEIRCRTCKEVIVPADALRGRVIPHRHDDDGDGCSGIILIHEDGRSEEMLVQVRGLSEAEMNATHALGLKRVVEQALDAMPDLDIGPEGADLTERFMEIALVGMQWEREGVAQQITEKRDKAEAYARNLPDRHDGASAAWSEHATLVDLVEEIRERDGTEAHTDALEVAEEKLQRVAQLAVMCRDDPGNVEECCVGLGLMDTGGIRRHEREDVGEMFCRILGLKRPLPEGARVITGGKFGDIIVHDLQAQRDGDECPDCNIRGYRDGAKLHTPDCTHLPKESTE